MLLISKLGKVCNNVVIKQAEQKQFVKTVIVSTKSSDSPRDGQSLESSV